MLYLTKEKVESRNTDSETSICYNGIYTTREEKLKFIALTNGNEIFLDLFTKLYPEAEKYKNAIHATWASIFNYRCLGISLQYAIAIIENPHIICTGYDVTLPYTRLFDNLSTITKIIKIEYNGNYAKITSLRGCIYDFSRILISKIDSEFIPSSPEFAYGVRSFYSKNCIWDPNKKYQDDTVFLNDYDIESFVNSDIFSVKYLWVILHNDKYFKELSFLKQHYPYLYVIVKIKEFDDYTILLKELRNYNFVVFSNSGGEFPLKEAELSLFVDSHLNAFFDSELNVTNRNLLNNTINYRDYGVIVNKSSFGFSSQKAFEEMRNLKNLPVNENQIDFRENEYFKIV